VVVIVGDGGTDKGGVDGDGLAAPIAREAAKAVRDY
jgi:hypothetical protein